MREGWGHFIVLLPALLLVVIIWNISVSRFPPHDEASTRGDGGRHMEDILVDGDGVKIETLRAGDGVTFPAPGQRVTCHYVLRLEDGQQVDSSRDRGRPSPSPWVARRSSRAGSGASPACLWASAPGSPSPVSSATATRAAGPSLAVPRSSSTWSF